MARRSMREEIVDAAQEQFHRYGFNAAGVKDITDRAGVPKGSFYNHFDSKESLAVVALERYGSQQRLDDLTDQKVEPVARIRANFEFLRDAQIGHGFSRGCLVGNFGNEMADHSEAIRTAVHQGLTLWAERIAGALREAQQAGSVRAELDPDKTGRFIVNAWEGTLIAARADKSGEAFESFFDLVFGSLLH
ncbi:MAG TPA: TetR family transcriptional regulator C-terminal domain-containing protein [Pseudonocardiaceae bacterium]|jgi:TetR/AcrR family transcriptional repressor of nem operon|nr:TetR family transcriptional regulator C-terminal domain-containing protein [Pseudonocardiaceae bacterium]